MEPVKTARVYSVCATVAFVVALPALAADGSEAVFRNALSYTVQVRTTLPVPFDGDNKGSSLGAGFLVDASRGWIMTNAHVVGRSPSRVEVSFHGGEFAETKKVYVDPFLDVAIIRAPDGARTSGIAEPSLECDSLPPVGHAVGAFGHPWRLPYTGTRGIISGVTSRYRTELLQTDAPINQGNSGGPLISLETGRIVGINTAGIRGAQNTNFAVAIQYACRILRLLQENADPSPPDLGVVYFQDVDRRKQLKVARSYAGTGTLKLLPGDIIRQVIGIDSPIENETQLLHGLRGRLADPRLRVIRDGAEIEIVGPIPPMPSVLETRGVYVSGVLFGPIDIRDAAEIRARGLMVHHVEPGSIGESREIEKNDLLEAVDGVPISDVETLYTRLREARSGRGQVTLTLKKLAGGSSLFSYAERRLILGLPRMIGPDRP